MNGNNKSRKATPTTSEVSVNWEGLRRFMGWEGSIAELKKIELDRAAPAGAAGTRDSE